MSVFQPTRVGDQVSGVVTRIEHTTSDYTTDPIPVFMLLDSATECEVRASHADLRRQLAGVSVGDYVSVRFEGKRNHVTKQLAHMSYSVEVSPASTSVPRVPTARSH